MDDPTVTIPATPKPSTMLLLGAAVAAAILAWAGSLIALTQQTDRHLFVICGFAVSSCSTSAAAVAWARYLLARDAARHQVELLCTLASQHALAMAEVRRVEGQYSMTMAEIRGLKRLVEETAGKATVEQEAMSVKLTKIMDNLPDYYNGVADMVEQMTGTEDNVRQIGRARVPRSIT